MTVALLVAAALMLTALNIAMAAYIVGLSSGRRHLLPLTPIAPPPQPERQPQEDSPANPEDRNEFVEETRRPSVFAGNPDIEGETGSWICDADTGIFAVLDGVGETGVSEACRRASAAIFRWITMTREKEGLDPSGSGDPDLEAHRLGLALDHAHAEISALKRKVIGKSPADFGCSAAGGGRPDCGEAAPGRLARRRARLSTARRTPAPA